MPAITLLTQFLNTPESAAQGGHDEDRAVNSAGGTAGLVIRTVNLTLDRQPSRCYDEELVTQPSVIFCPPAKVASRRSSRLDLTNGRFGRLPAVDLRVSEPTNEEVCALVGCPMVVSVSCDLRPTGGSPSSTSPTSASGAGIRVGHELRQTRDVHLRHRQHDQRRAVAAGRGEEGLGLAQQECLLLRLTADEQHGDVGPDPLRLAAARRVPRAAGGSRLPPEMTATDATAAATSMNSWAFCGCVERSPPSGATGTLFARSR